MRKYAFLRPAKEVSPMESPMNTLLEKLWSFLLAVGPRILAAALIVLVGLLLTKILVKIMKKPLEKANMDYSLKRFLIICVRVLCIVIIAISAMSALGISSAGLLAALGGAAVAVSLALKDSLSNLAAGILLLLSHPFATGDYIEADDLAGTVQR